MFAPRSRRQVGLPRNPERYGSKVVGGENLSLMQMGTLELCNLTTSRNSDNKMICRRAEYHLQLNLLQLNSS